MKKLLTILCLTSLLIAGCSEKQTTPKDPVDDEGEDLKDVKGLVCVAERLKIRFKFVPKPEMVKQLGQKETEYFHIYINDDYLYQSWVKKLKSESSCSRMIGIPRELEPKGCEKITLDSIASSNAVLEWWIFHTWTNFIGERLLSKTTFTLDRVSLKLKEHQNHTERVDEETHYQCSLSTAEEASRMAEKDLEEELKERAKSYEENKQERQKKEEKREELLKDRKI